jgi:ATP-dependent Clp protease ATP-binding subunit ClpA
MSNRPVFDSEVELILRKATQTATASYHEDLGLVHIIIELLNSNSTIDIFRALEKSVDPLTKAYKKLLDEMPAYQPTEAKQPRTTPKVNHILHSALTRAISSGRNEVKATDLLMAIYDDQGSHLNELLGQMHISRLDLQKAVSRKKSKNSGEKETMGGSENSTEEEQSALSKYAINLNDRAQKGKIDPLIGRDSEVQRVAQVLCRRRKNNPLFLGEPGVGKTAIAEGLAQKIVQGDVPEPLKEMKIFSLDMGALLAGTKYRGDFEERIKGVIEEAKADPNICLMIDEVHTLIGAGAAGSGNMDASNLLKPSLASGELKIIAATTHDEYRKIFEKDKALTRRFQPINVNEPTVEATIKILHGLKSNFEKHHGVEFTDEAIEAAVKLSARHIHDRFLPDKAIDVMDDSGSWQRVIDSEKRVKLITEKEVGEAVARLAKIPEEQICGDDREKLEHLEENIKLKVFGQDHAVTQLADAVKIARAGLRKKAGTQGAFFFVGPTGVGKTEVTSQLAEQLGVPLIRFDMSEYMESHSVAKLIGSPPGYVGYDSGGLLTEAVAKVGGTCVLLLDEIEKAHPDIQNILLQMMDRGVVTDSHGREVDFSNVLLVMTSNLGATVSNRRTMGFVKQDHTSDANEVIKKSLAPEFINRLDAVVTFNPLGFEHIRKVADKMLLELECQLAEQNVILDVSEEARDWIAKGGFDPAMGGRPMSRFITSTIKKNIVNELLFGELKNGGTIRVSLKDDNLVFKNESLVLKEKPVKVIGRKLKV